MKRLLILPVVFMFIMMPCYSKEMNINLENKSKTIETNRYDLKLFKPSRIILNQDNKILVEGKPGNFVSVAYSKYNSGADNLMGQSLRLGSDFKTIEGTLNDKGFAELNLNLNESVVKEGETLYFEVASWSQKDYKDLRLANIYNTSGKITDSNAVIVVRAKKGLSIPMLSPGMGMPNTNINETMDAIENINNGTYDESKYIYPKEFYYDRPSMFMNINAPELLRK
ncbi:MAG: hypothetical protein WCK67_06020 [bacterium]